MKAKLASNRSPDWAFMEKFIVPHYDDPKVDYLYRIRIIQTPWFGVYLHRLGSADPRDTLHGHPWPFLALVLRGGYDEQVKTGSTPLGVYSERHIVRRINYKRLSDWHWIERLHRTPTWTLVFVGRRAKVWGYRDRDGTETEFDKHPFNDQFLEALNKKKDADV